MKKTQHEKQPLDHNFDYKDVALLKRFINPYGRMQARRYSGLSAKQQRQLATAVKHARFMGLLPFIAR